MKTLIGIYLVLLAFSSIIVLLIYDEDAKAIKTGMLCAALIMAILTFGIWLIVG